MHLDQAPLYPKFLILLTASIHLEFRRLFFEDEEFYMLIEKNNLETKELEQLAANIYLLMPNDGGAIQMWNQELPADQFDAMRGDSYGIDPYLLGKPDLVVEPGTGDLVLFNSQLMHAVTPGSANVRLSIPCFVGYRGPAMPLTFWS